MLKTNIEVGGIYVFAGRNRYMVTRINNNRATVVFLGRDISGRFKIGSPWTEDIRDFSRCFTERIC